MNPWPFVIAAYVVGLGGTATLILVSWRGLRRAEGEAERIGRPE